MSELRPSKIFTSDEGYELNLRRIDNDLLISVLHDTMDDEACFTTSVIIVPKWREPSVSHVLYDTIASIIERSEGCPNTLKEYVDLVPKIAASTDKTDHRVNLSMQLQETRIICTADSINHTKRGGIVHGERFPVTMHFTRSAQNDLLIPVVLSMHIAQYPNADREYQYMMQIDDPGHSVFATLPKLAQKLTV